MDDVFFMKRALELAKKGRGNVAPNPMVGCVVVYNNAIISEGFHEEYGQAHAEPNALLKIENPEIIKDSTVYVTLEPCNHFGKTPPCADLLVKLRPKKVVICNQDPFPKVNGTGIEKLKAAGIETKVALLDEEGKLINRRFFTFHKEKRPYIILKWAETQDGFVARENYDSKWISSADSRTLVHKWRAEEASILVGSNTALHDNPRLDVRLWEGKNPIRLLIDRNLKVPVHYNLFDDSVPTIVFNSEKDETTNNTTWKKIDFSKADFLYEILTFLYEQNIQSVFIEGGSKVLNWFYEQNLWDEIRQFKAQKTFGNGIKAPDLSFLTIEESITVNEDDQLNIFVNKKFHSHLIGKEFSFVG